jgi:hypothetical protein
MTTKNHPVLACTICVSLCITSHALAQQSKPILPTNASQPEMSLPYGASATYSFNVYNGPNNMFGYDILKNGKPVYHQFVLTALSHEGKRLYASKPQAEKTATLAIVKIKNGQPPTFTNEELLKILSL